MSCRRVTFEFPDADSLQQRASDVKHGGGQKPSDTHLVAELRESVRKKAMCYWYDSAQAEADEDLGACTAVRRLAVLRVEHDVRRSCVDSAVSLNTDITS